MGYMLKKIALPALGVFLMLTVINISIGIVFWLRNINRKPMENYVDAPYIYYQRENKNRFQNGFDISPAVNKNKNVNEVRILMLGGSVANGLMNLSVKDGSPSWGKDNGYLEALIQKQFEGIKITLLNGANPAYVSEQEFIAFQIHLQYYQPDIIIGLHGFNDVESFRMNHLVDDSDFIPSPLFYSGSWDSPLFNILESHKKKYTRSYA
jgi:hypothetical protein